jgi:hypothetical protein
VPIIAAFPVDNHISGFGWPEGASVTLTIDDPGTLWFPDYTATEVVIVDPVVGEVVDFPLQGVFQLRPGHLVTLSDGVIPKAHVVTNLAVTAGDMATDTIWGTTDPGTQVDVALQPFIGDACRWVTADANGDWLADFSIPSDEWCGTIYDIGPDTVLMVMQGDDDGDHTQIDWRAPTPLIMAHLIDDVHGVGWPYGATLTLTIDDPATSQSPDYEETQVVPDDGTYPNNHVIFDLLHREFDLQPGQTITMTDGITTKTHVVRDLAFSLVNEHTDTVTGKAQSGSEVGVNIYDEEPHPGHLVVFTNEDGSWVADFSSIYDIVPGTSLNIGQGDEDGDWTQDEFGSILAIDIMPGSRHNPIIPRSRVRIPVAILTTDTFDATTVDLTYFSIRFGATGTEAAPVRSALVDVDRDGDTDMLLLFNTRDTGIECGDTFAFLAITRMWPYHLSNMGADRIMTVGCRWRQ